MSSSNPRDSDRNFDDIKGLFQRRIYQTSKGRIRLAVLDRDLRATVPALYDEKDWPILDAGCGEAQFASHFIPAQHDLTLCDHSAEMIELAREQILSRMRGSRCRFFNEGIQAFSAKQQPQSYQLILCHAVLEWVADPVALLKQLRSLLKPQGYLSLMFFNRHSTVFRCLVRGYLDKAKQDNVEGSGQGLTPINPLVPADIIRTTQELGFQLLCHSGVRVFQDYMHYDVRSKRSEQDITELELQYSQQEPYRSLGRYIHLVLKYDN